MTALTKVKECRCPNCNNTDLTAHSNFCEVCYSGQCSSCGADTRYRRK